MGDTQPYALARIFRVGTPVQWEMQIPVAAGGWVMSQAGTEGDMLIAACAEGFNLQALRPDATNPGDFRYWFRMPS